MHPGSGSPAAAAAGLESPCSGRGAAQAAGAGATEPAGGGLQLEEHHLPPVQDCLHHPGRQPAGKAWTRLSVLDREEDAGAMWSRKTLGSE